MRKFFQIVFLIFIIGAWVVVFSRKEAVRDFVQNDLGINKSCSKPLKYSIGNIDPRFEISEEEAKVIVIKAENIWDASLDKNLLEYDPNSQFKINLIYDERQEMSDKSEELNNKLDQLESERDLISSQYDRVSGSLKKRIDEYKKDVKEYEERLKDFNDDIKYWNSRGGAPKDKYEELKKEEKELKKIYENLEDERKAINSLISKTNNLAAQESIIVRDYNASINTYKSKYGGSREFEKGLFSGEAINIYEFQDVSDLEMTLIHELGHYLGIGHTENPKSIMYPMIGEQDMLNPSLMSDDLNALKNVCNLY